jgi:hypothetical protein
MALLARLLAALPLRLVRAGSSVPPLSIVQAREALLILVLTVGHNFRNLEILGVRKLFDDILQL